MYLACSTLSFASLGLDEALRKIRELDFSKADLAIHDTGPHLTPEEVNRDTTKIAQKLRTANLQYAAIHLDFQKTPPEVALEQLAGVCRLGRLLAIPLLTVAASPNGTPIDHEVARLRQWYRMAAKEGLMLALETRAGTLTAEPTVAKELCEKVDGLGLTLDPSYFLTKPEEVATYEELLPYVRHVRLRDTGPGPENFQVRIGQGEVEFGRLVSQLERIRYSRSLSVDIRDHANVPFQVEPEVRKLKYLLESVI